MRGSEILSDSIQDVNDDQVLVYGRKGPKQALEE